MSNFLPKTDYCVQKRTILEHPISFKILLRNIPKLLSIYRLFLYHILTEFIVIVPTNTESFYFFSKYFCTLFTALAPSATAVIICLSSFVLVSPATKIPGKEVSQFSPATM